MRSVDMKINVEVSSDKKMQVWKGFYTSVLEDTGVTIYKTSMDLCE